jgi:hypothetical protein
MPDRSDRRSVLVAKTAAGEVLLENLRHALTVAARDAPEVEPDEGSHDWATALTVNAA